MANRRQRQIESDLRYLAWRSGVARRPNDTGDLGGCGPGGPGTPGVRLPAETTRLYHLTPVSEAEGVVRDGIHAGVQGCIYCFNELSSAEVIAREQVFARRYAVFEIDLKGVGVAVETDVAVWVWEPYQRVIRQRHVAPQHLTLVGVYDLARAPTERDYRRGERRGWTRERTEAVFDLSERFAAGEITTGQFNEALRRVREQHGRRQEPSMLPAGNDCPHGGHQHWPAAPAEPTAGEPGGAKGSESTFHAADPWRE